MSVSVNIPEITVLRSRVEEKYGKMLETHNGFIALVSDIEAKVREHVSESTLERMWGYSTREADDIFIVIIEIEVHHYTEIFKSFKKSKPFQFPKSSLYLDNG